MIFLQKEIVIKTKYRGFHLITDEILSNIDISQIMVGMLNIFLQHTSASLSINENYDISVRNDLEKFFTKLCDNKPYYTHTLEGSDDMPAHIKSTIIGNSLTIPITNGKLNMGVWQGIYLNEHRDFPTNRKIILTVIGKKFEKKV